jgi:Lar family restriction alleviation protein
MGEAQLKPCPFCGSTKLEMRNTEPKNLHFAYVWCNKCGACGPDNNHPSVEDTTRCWNDRV